MESNRLVKILCVVCAAGCCLSSCGSTGEEKPKKLSSVSTGVTTTVTTNKKSAEILEAEAKQHMEHAFYLSEQLSLF